MQQFPQRRLARSEVTRLQNSGSTLATGSQKRRRLNKVIVKVSMLFVIATLFGFDETDNNYLSKDQLERGKRGLLPSFCKENLLFNGDFEADGGSLGEWHASYAKSKIELIEHEFGHAMIYTERTKIYHGPKHRLIHAIECFGGSEFYFQIQAKIRMYDQDTGEGLTKCSHDQLHAGEDSWKKGIYCPIITIITQRSGGGDIPGVYFDYYDIHDTDMELDPTGWNTMDVIYKVPDVQSGEKIENAFIQFYGGPVGAAIWIDDVVLRRIDEGELPEGHPIYDPIKPSCSDNILRNGDGEYKSPFGWDNFGRWISEFSIDAVPSEHDSDGFSLIAVDRNHPHVQGIGQFLINKCFNGLKYYLHVEADVQLYDQTTGLGSDLCERAYHTNKLTDCPYFRLIYKDKNKPGTSIANFFDRELSAKWDPNNWNKIDLVIAMAPGPTEPQYWWFKMNFVGGPFNSVLKIDNVRARILPYDELPAGNTIRNLEGDLTIAPIKTCISRGDPHIISFTNRRFENHLLGWSLLFEYGDLKVETRQVPVSGATVYDDNQNTIYEAAINDAVRLTYNNITYDYSNGILPGTDNQYYDPVEEKLYFHDPPVSVFMKRRSWTTDGYFYNVWVVTSSTNSAGGLCAVVDEADIIETGSVNKTEFQIDAPTYEEAESICSALEETDDFEDCITDVRLVNDHNIAPVFVEAALEASDVEARITQAVESEVQAATTLEILDPPTAAPIDASTVAPTFAPTNQDRSGAVLGDPLILGLNNQVFKFDGKSDAWYANLAAESLQWNMKFHKFSHCPKEEDMFVTGVGIGVYSPGPVSRIFDKGVRTLLHSVAIKVKDEDSFSPGCDQGFCLGDGSLELVVDNIPIVRPGDYSFPGSGGIRVVAYNILGECSRKWYDYVEPEESVHDSIQEELNRDLFLSEKGPIDFLMEGKGEMVNSDICSGWVKERMENGDLFSQAGAWSTVHIVTPTVNFHIEYRQNSGEANDVCSYHSLDTWMSKITPDLKDQDWQGILGETRWLKHDSNGNEINSDRSMLLFGKMDSDYEVSGPFETEFLAQKFTPWFWRIHGKLRRSLRRKMQRVLRRLQALNL